MARSIADIPTELLNNPDKTTFINWLASIPAPRSSKRYLISVYSQATGLRFTATEYAAMMPPPPETPHA